MDNKLLPKLKSYCRIASFLNNKFGKRLESDVENQEEILHQLESDSAVENTLSNEVEEKGWNRKKVVFQQLLSSDLLDFPEMTEKELKIFFTGTYQYTQSISYLAELLDDDNNITNSLGSTGIKRYCCDCPNGRRTIGCCAHVAAIIYYLSYARYLSKIIRPAEILSKIFTVEQFVPIINEDSEDDD